MDTVATSVKKARYLPELIPNLYWKDLDAGLNIIDELRLLPPKAVSLAFLNFKRIDGHIRLIPDGNALDYIYLQALKDLDTPTAPSPYPDVHELDVWASKSFKIQVYNNTGGSVTGYDYKYGFWVFEPSIAEKIVHSDIFTVTKEELELAEKYGALDTIKKGTLPLPREYQILREYQIVKKVIRGRHVDTLTTDGMDAGKIVVPSPDYFIVLTGFAMTSAPDASTTVNLVIDRDEDSRYVEARAIPIGGSGIEHWTKCFIPALSEIKVYVETNASVSNFNVRYEYWLCKMTNLIKVRWGLEHAREEYPELYDKIRVGIL